MKRSLALGIAALALAAGAWSLWRAQQPGVRHASAPDRPAVKLATGESSVITGQSVHAKAPRFASAPAARATPVRAGIEQEFLDAKEYRPLYDRLRNSPEGATAEGAFVLYQIATRCASVTDRPSWRAPNRGRTNEQQREAFMKALPANDPMREKRLAAFEQVNASHCDGFSDVSMSRADLRAMLSTAADAGSAEAKALQVEQEARLARRGHWDGGTLTDAQIDTLKQAVSSKDPGAILQAGRILSNTYSDITVRDGEDGPAMEPRALHNAWAVVACEYGYPCGQDNARLAAACAYQGHCEASNLQDYLYYYAASPHDAQLMNQYESILRNAVESGDWSRIAFVRGPRAPNTPRFYFGPAS